MLPQVQKILQASRVVEFFKKWQLDEVKESYFRGKMSKITKGQIFCTIFNFLEAQQPNFRRFWGSWNLLQLPFSSIIMY